MGVVWSSRVVVNQLSLPQPLGERVENSLNSKYAAQLVGDGGVQHGGPVGEPGRVAVGQDDVGGSGVVELHTYVFRVLEVHFG